MSVQKTLSLAVCTLAFSSLANAGMIIQPFYDLSVSSRADYSQIQAAFSYASSAFTSIFSDNITVNISVKASSAVGLGQSSLSPILVTGGYGTVRTKLIADASSTDDATAVSYLSATDPTGGGTFVMPRAQAKALGLLGATNGQLDGTFTFSSNVTFTFDLNNRAQSGKYDFVAVAEHEISEILGRNQGLDTAGYPYYMANDLFRYSAPGTRSMTAGASAYFSIDGGNTNLKAFNTVAPGDFQDWASGTNDPFNAYTSSGVQADLTAVGIRAMDVIGYNLITTATPEPSEVLPFLLSFGFIGVRLRRNRNS